MLLIKKIDKKRTNRKKIYARAAKKIEPGKVYRISVSNDDKGGEVRVEINK